MDDLISRKAAILQLSHNKCGNEEWDIAVQHDIETITQLPSAQPERPKGHWIVWGGMDIPENHGKHKCSICGEFAPVRYEKPLIKEYLSDFCPNCGADMRGGE